MSPKSLTSRHSIDSCMFQLHTWKPFTNSKTLDSDSNPNKPSSNLHTKRPCLSDRATSLFSLSIDKIDFSKLSLFDDGVDKSRRHNIKDRFRWMAGKRRRKGSRSVSGRSSDRSGTRNGKCCSLGATATCSDFMVAAGGTDSSGELFLHGNGNGNDSNGWASDVSEARRESGSGNGNGNGSGERDASGSGFAVGSVFDGQGCESGYGSEPGYRGDAEFGYGDEVDDEDEDIRVLMWEDGFGDAKMEMVGENKFSEQKAYHRGRRKKHDWRMIDSHR